MFRNVLMFATAISFSVSCKPPVNKAATKTVSAGEATLWPTGTIPVCWENKGPATENIRARYEKHIQEQFEKTNVAFVGWGGCLPNSKGLRIFIYDDPDNSSRSELISLKDEIERSSADGSPGHPRVQAFGRALDGVVGGLVLTMRFKNVEPFLSQMVATMSPDAVQNLSDSIVLHEFGHVINLRHEDAHPERSCDTYAEPLEDGNVVSAYVPDSAMSRCFYRHVDYSKEKLRLSAGDIDGINKLYPKRNAR